MFRELGTHPIRYMRHVRYERQQRRRNPYNVRGAKVVPMQRTATGRLVERPNRAYHNLPYPTEFVPLRQMPGALFRYGRIRRNVIPEPREVELQYSYERGWRPVKPNLPARSKSNTARLNARRNTARRITRTNARTPRTNARRKAWSW